MTIMATPMVSDELAALVSALCQKYPQLSPAEVETVVARVYAELAANARVTAHLIPLTLNRSRRLLADGADGGVDAEAQSAGDSHPHDRQGPLATSVRTNAS